MNESSDKAPNIEIDYGKNVNRKTVLIRLKVKVKSKRKKIFELFIRARHLMSTQEHAVFTEGFNGLVKSDSHDIVWCKFKWKGDKRWHEVSSNDLIYGLVDVAENNEYLYLAFDTEKLEKNGKLKLDDFVYFIFFNLPGVTKIWIKVRLDHKYSHELYSHHPGMGDEAFFDKRDITNDNYWPG